MQSKDGEVAIRLDAPLQERIGAYAARENLMAGEALSALLYLGLEFAERQRTGLREDIEDLQREVRDLKQMVDVLGPAALGTLRGPGGGAIPQTIRRPRADAMLRAGRYLERGVVAWRRLSLGPCHRQPTPYGIVPKCGILAGGHSLECKIGHKIPVDLSEARECLCRVLARFVVRGRQLPHQLVENDRARACQAKERACGRREDVPVLFRAREFQKGIQRNGHGIQSRQMVERHGRAAPDGEQLVSRHYFE